MRLRLAALSAVTLAALGACTENSIPSAVLPPDDIPAATATAALGPDGIAPAPTGRVIVRFRQSSAPGLAVAAAARQRAVERFAERHGARAHGPMLLSRTWLIETAPGTEEELVAVLNDDAEVDFAEVDRLIVLDPCETGECATTNDPFRGYKWDLHNPGSIFNTAGTNIGATGKADADIDWLEAYDALGAAWTGTATVGVVDTGILPTHQDLTGRVVAAFNHASGYLPTLTQDRNGHGTHVAGIAAASGNNTKGVAGVAFGSNIKLLNAKACEYYSFPGGVISVSCASSSVANAIIWATNNGANVINLSLGGPSPSLVQQAALQYARSKNVLPLCATGNDGSASVISYPARFPECVAVGATDWADKRAPYSNAGAQIALSAPGGTSASSPLGNSFILAPVPSKTFFSPASAVENNSTYGWKSGTSMATPQVTGLAAVLYAEGLTTPAAVTARMRETVDDLGTSGWDTQFGAGRINACRALDPAVVRIEMPGAINSSEGSGVVPVTLFGGPRFNVEQFDVADLTLGDGSGEEVSVAVRGDDFRSAIADVDGDGVMDLTLKFSRQALTDNGDLNPGMRRMVLRGNVGCRRVEGGQTVKVK